MATLSSLGIGHRSSCFIVAEIGQNHQGSLEEAKNLILEAKSCGANCVKFQKSCLQERFTKKALDDPYVNPNSFGSTYGEHRKNLEFSEIQFKELQAYAKEVGILFTSSAMDIKSADLLIQMNVPFIKIGSGDTNNFLLIEHIAKSKIPVILSTGMQEFPTVKFAHDLISKYHKEFAILHCVSSYPTDPKDVNLAIIGLYKKEFPATVIGYSGHEKGINIAIAAVTLGAKVVEKHLTRNKIQKGTDHQCSLDISEFKEMVNGIREVEAAIGIARKVILPSEKPCRNKLGKSIVAAKRIFPGQIQYSDLKVKVSRPLGLEPEHINSVIGLSTNKIIEEDSPLYIENLVVSLKP